jgi:hypothetical protein
MTRTKGSRLADDQIVNEGRILSISCEKLSPETLRAVIEEYVTRSGTDYGDVEVPLEQKVRQVHRELLSGKARILFDTIDQTCNIVSKDDFKSF